MLRCTMSFQWILDSELPHSTRCAAGVLRLEHMSTATLSLLVVLLYSTSGGVQLLTL